MCPVCIAAATVAIAGAASAGGLTIVAVKAFVAPTAAPANTKDAQKEAAE